MWATIIKMWNRYSYVYIQGLTGTLCLAAITVLCGTVLGTLLAIMRRSRIKPFPVVHTVLCLGSQGNTNPSAALFFLDLPSQSHRD